MYILQGLLTVLLAAGGQASAASALKPFAGAWKGMVTVAPNNCVWDVSGQIMEKGSLGHGGFTYSGPCDREPKSGTFSAKPSGGACYSATVSIPGMPPLPLTACIGPGDTITFDSLMVKGTLKISEGNTRADLASASMVGSATGIFKREGKAPASPGLAAGKKGKPAKGRPAKRKEVNNDDGVKTESPEVLIGGY